MSRLNKDCSHGAAEQYTLLMGRGYLSEHCSTGSSKWQNWTLQKDSKPNDAVKCHQSWKWLVLLSESLIKGCRKRYGEQVWDRSMMLTGSSSGWKTGNNSSNISRYAVHYHIVWLRCLAFCVSHAFQAVVWKSQWCSCSCANNISSELISWMGWLLPVYSLQWLLCCFVCNIWIGHGTLKGLDENHGG